MNYIKSYRLVEKSIEKQEENLNPTGFLNSKNEIIKENFNIKLNNYKENFQ